MWVDMVPGCRWKSDIDGLGLQELGECNGDQSGSCLYINKNLSLTRRFSQTIASTRNDAESGDCISRLALMGEVLFALGKVGGVFGGECGVALKGFGKRLNLSFLAFQPRSSLSIPF